MIKVLFLDVDGVLNTNEDWFEESILGHKYNNGCEQINRTKLALLQYVVDETDCKIVLSSSWRHHYSLDNFYKILKVRGFKSGNIFIGSTSRDTYENIRGNEIKTWLQTTEHKVKSYAIVDDCEDMLDEQKKFFVKTDGEHGLTLKDCDKLIKILGSC